MHNPFLVGEHIYLRAIESADLNDAYREWFNDEEICRYNSHHRFPNYDENMHSYFESTIKSQTNLILAIVDKATDIHIGNVALENINPVDRAAEFAIIIGNKNLHGKGIGRDATRLILKHGFEQLGLERVYCGTAEDNIGMQKLAAAVGFVQEGRARKALFKNNTFKDVINYGLLRDELKQ